MHARRHVHVHGMQGRKEREKEGRKKEARMKVKGGNMYILFRAKTVEMGKCL